MTPPHHQSPKQKQQTEDLASIIAMLLDTAFSIPGTTIRIGLDPILGLIPGIGDYISNLIGSSLLFMASRAGVPRIVIFRMALNIFLNMLIGVIPGIGDLFSFWFKSNVRNANLLHQHSQASPPQSTTIDWLYVASIVLGMLLILTFILFSAVWLLNQLWQALA